MKGIDALIANTVEKGALVVQKGINVRDYYDYGCFL